MLVTGGQYVGDKTSPGPGAYNCREINKKVIAFTFRPKTTAGKKRFVEELFEGRDGGLLETGIV